MKKTISLILAALMLLSVLSVTAMAANGPNPDRNEYEEYTAHIFFYNVKTDGGDVGIFYDNELKDTIEGAEYDVETNTLTLTDFNHPEFSLSIADMGDDFKLNIQGECVLQNIIVNTETYGGSLTVTGTGLLTVNPERSDETAVRLWADGADATLHIDDTVSVKFLSSWNAVSFDGTAHADKDTVFTQGEKTVNVKGGKTKNVLCVDGAYLDYDNMESVGYKAHQVNDPDCLYGVYVVNISESAGAGDIYHVERYVVDEKTGRYVKDESFDALDLTKEDFEAEYVLEKTTSTEPKTIEYLDENSEKQTGYLVEVPGQTPGSEELFVIDIDYNKETDEIMHRIKPIEYTVSGEYKIVQTWSGYEIDYDSFFNRGYKYVYEDVNVEFTIPTMQTGNYPVREDEEHNQYIFTNDTVYKIDENRKIEIGGEEHYVMTPWQGITEDNTSFIEIEEDKYNYLYEGEKEGEEDDEDYIYIAQIATPDETATSEPATFESAPSTEDVTSETADVTDRKSVV